MILYLLGYIQTTKKFRYILIAALPWKTASTYYTLSIHFVIDWAANRFKHRHRHMNTGNFTLATLLHVVFFFVQIDFLTHFQIIYGFYGCLSECGIPFNFVFYGWLCVFVSLHFYFLCFGWMLRKFSTFWVLCVFVFVFFFFFCGSVNSIDFFLSWKWKFVVHAFVVYVDCETCFSSDLKSLFCSFTTKTE